MGALGAHPAPDMQACAKAGLVLVSVNPASRASELVYALRKVGCVALVTAAADALTDNVAVLASIVPEVSDAHSPASLRSARLPSLRHVIVLDASSTTLLPPAAPPRRHPTGAHTWAELVRLAGRADVAGMQAAAAAVDADAICAVQARIV